MHIHRVEKHHFIIIAAILSILLVLEQPQLFGISDLFGFLVLFLLKALLWTALGVLIHLFPRALPAGLIRLQGMLAALAAMIGLFHLLGLLILGLFTAFSENSFDLTPIGIASNLISMGAALFGGELCRSFLINSLSQRRPFRAILGFSVLFAAFNIPLGGLSGLSDKLSILNFITGTALPRLTESYAASCLAYLAGPLPAILYLGILRTFSYLSPYIPNPSEIPKLLFNLLFPLLSITVVLKIYAGESDKDARYIQKSADTFGWVAVSALSVMIVWFAVGLFPIFPSVILTGSMEPGIRPGDLIIVEKIDGKEAQVGDIVMYFSEDGINITHRILERSEEAGLTQFILKGDNNSSVDPSPVQAEQIRGRVLLTLPKFGKAALFFRQLGSQSIGGIQSEKAGDPL